MKQGAVSLRGRGEIPELVHLGVARNLYIEDVKEYSCVPEATCCTAQYGYGGAEYFLERE